MESCSHLWADASQHQLGPFDCVQRRAIRFIGNPMLCEGFETLVLRRDVFSLCVLCCIYHGECSEELFDLLPAAESSNRTVRHKLKYHPHHLDTWHSTPVRFRKNFLLKLWHALPAAVFPGQYHMNTIKSISTLKAGNAPVAPLVLHRVVGGGDHLPSGDPNANDCLRTQKTDKS